MEPHTPLATILTSGMRPSEVLLLIFVQLRVQSVTASGASPTYFMLMFVWRHA
jgi:hypothetical protein